MEPTEAHRKDIDGLRAVAVVLVVLYHYGIGPFSGGYVGVDVFFVISGYVITAKVRRELAAGTFTLRGFYAGRIRRILPALAFMILACLIAGWFLLMPSDYRDMGNQAAYAAVGLSNFYFLDNSGYFARASDLLPLLHTWSLGVEEQFYLLWPLLILGLVHLKLSASRTILVLSGLITISLALSTLVVVDDQPRAFYMLHTRAWELALGGLLTLLPPLRLSLMANLAGLSLIALSAIFLETRSTFPGLLAIPVCLGAALLVWPKNQPDPISRVLGIKPFVALGLLSYSLYLWHWPILVYYRHVNFEQDPTLGWKVALMAVSVAAAWFSYRVVEQPIRTKRSLSKVAVPGPLAASLFIAITGLGVAGAAGVPARIPPAALSIAAGATDVSPHRSACHRPVALAGAPIDASCRLGYSGVEPSMLIWGDSHAVELGDALAELVGDEGRSLLSVTYSSCPPAVGFERTTRPQCNEHNSAVLDYIESTDTIETVLLAARYEMILREDNSQKFVDAMDNTVSALLAAGKKVVIFAPVPTTDGSVPLVASRMMMHDAHSAPTIDMERYRASNSAILDLMAEMEALAGVSIIDVTSALCDGETCQTTVDGQSLYFDNHHLSKFGARWLVENLDLPIVI